MNINYMQLLIDSLSSKKLVYIPIEELSSLENVYNLFVNGKLFEPTNEIEYFYYGVYYGKFVTDYDLMKKYYLMAIKSNNQNAMYNLAYYYEMVEKNYDLMKKYYLMAIELNNTDAMNNLAYYYKDVERNYDLMKKFYLMAIELNDAVSMNNLGYYYETVEKNYDLMKKYYLMAIEHKNKNALYYLYKYYIKNNKYIELIKLCIEFKDVYSREQLIESLNNAFINLQENNTRDFINIISNIVFTKEDKLIQPLKMYINSLNSKISLMELHFNYTLEGKGYNEAKTDFIKRITLN